MHPLPHSIKHTQKKQWLVILKIKASKKQTPKRENDPLSRRNEANVRLDGCQSCVGWRTFPW